MTTPPYDTISAEEQARLRAASPYNVIRLDLGEGPSDGDADDDKYTRAASELGRWRRDKVLVESASPSYYPYEILFARDGRQARIRGLVCAVDLEPWGGAIVPHERTMEPSVTDRLRLMRSVRANLSAIYAVFPGPCAPLRSLLDDVAAEAPRFDLADEEGVTHRMWGLTGAREVASWLAEEPLLIADGHHRYAMALRYQEEMRAENGPGPWDQVMMLIVDGATERPPVLPIHRLLVSGDPPGDGVRVADLDEVLGAVSDDGLRYGMVARRGSEVVHSVAQLEGRPPLVCALHEQVLDGRPDWNLRFTPDAAAAERSVGSGESRAAFFLPPTTADRIRGVADRGGRMPQKSTFFWPKPRTGMVIRSLS